MELVLIMLFIPTILAIGLAIVKFGFFFSLLITVGFDICFIFVGSIAVIDPYMGKIAGGKFGNGLLNVIFAIIVLCIYFVLLFFLRDSKKLKPLFYAWNLGLSVYGGYYLYEIIMYCLLKVLGANATTTVIPIFKWTILNKGIYYFLILIVSGIIMNLRLSFLSQVDEKEETEDEEIQNYNDKNNTYVTFKKSK